MARSWAQLLGDTDAPAETETEQRGFFGRLRESLSKSRRALTEQIQVAAFDPTDDASWERLEEALIYADVGVRATAELVRRLEARADLHRSERGARRGDRGALRRAADARARDRPAVILVVGVNGTGKTTTIGKLASRLHASGRTVTLGAADTFRAAAEEQLEIWAERAGASFVGGERGGDPAAVAYDAVGADTDVVIVDTAGRLHTQTNLMDELAKVRRVIAGRRDGAPHEVLLVVDATTGQNGLQQARLFGEAVGVTGVALTKLDGSAKGGIAVAIAYELGIPVKLVGVGETLDDLRPFDADDFARALVSRMTIVPASQFDARRARGGDDGRLRRLLRARSCSTAAQMAAVIDLWDIDLDRSRVAVGDDGRPSARAARRSRRARVGRRARRRSRGARRGARPRVDGERARSGTADVSLEVIEANEPALRLYRELGFEQTRVLELWTLTGDVPPAEARAAEPRPLGQADVPWQSADESLPADYERLEVDGGAVLFVRRPHGAHILQLEARDEATARQLICAVASATRSSAT